jgi:hypothetical protein
MQINELQNNMKSNSVQSRIFIDKRRDKVYLIGTEIKNTRTHVPSLGILHNKT